MFFQNSVIKKYLASQDAELIAKAWETYKAYFLNPAVQENIRASKEEQFQEGFLRELFVKVFGYTLNPMPDFNLITEQKNENDAKKADGAILRDGKVIGVIELKDHKTTDLSHVERQAFGYKSQHKDTKYVVISNFEKLRFYIDNAVEHIEWNLFTITQEQFRLLYFCLSWANIQADKPLKAKQDSVSNEDEVTQKLYKDYSAFKREIFADILANNTTEETPKEQILLLFKKTQKLLDRLLFIFFAEDSGLLPPNLMMRILTEWEKLKEMDEYRPLYERIKKYFVYLNEGHSAKNPSDSIFAYNGGLFKTDEVLDGLTISDELLARFTRKLADYDYSTDVDVNILGHIFENSLNEIEEVTAQINNSPNGQPAPVLNRRKRDGVFYTPQYITKYIVENTVGKLCAEKKAEMGIDEQEYFADKNRQTATKKRLLDQLTAYREWLLGITICDPACGSGAFLNAALQFLMAEHKLIDEMEAKLTGSELIFPNIENSILENNLYGVDINEESVEIARLALWLRTAKPHRKLSSLNNNIKCGNSLISDPEIAGEKAFNWQAEFPQVFAKGGFDVVIGNPPYVSTNMQMASLEMATQRQAIIDSHRYKTLIQKWDLYIPFIELGIRYLCKDKGRCSMIVPYPLTNQLYAQKSREMLLNEFSLYEVADLRGTKVFEDATVTSTIFFVQRQIEKQEINISKIENNALQPVYKKDKDSLLQDEKSLVWNLDNSKKITNRHEGMKVLGDYCYISKGMVLNSDEKKAKGEFIKEDLISLTKDEIHCRGYVEAKDIDKYIINRVRYLEYNTDRSPEKLSRPTFRELYNIPKLLTNKIGPLKVTIDINNLLCDQTNRICVLWKDLKGVENNSIIVSLKKYSAYSRTQLEQLSENVDILYLLAILNSKYANCLLDDIRGDGNIDVNPEYIRNIPIPECTDQQPFIDLADKMLSLNKDLQAKRTRFIRRLQDNMPDIKITGTLETFDTLDFAGFVAELKKQKIKLSLVQQDEWEDFFIQYKTACTELTSAISATDAEIDTRVYALYGLTEDEIKVIEG
ncbi:MAG: N-6 DNA methylase [Paludibacteraceae bacterium]|nr:N-6 DNA methylase [Paludibacteraceae bacterium]